VVAPWEAEGTPHPVHPTPPPVIGGWVLPEVCLPGEGTVGEIGKIFWEAKQAS